MEQIGNVSLTVADIPNAASKGYVNTAVAGNIAVLNSSFNSVNANVAAAKSYNQQSYCPYFYP